MSAADAIRKSWEILQNRNAASANGWRVVIECVDDSVPTERRAYAVILEDRRRAETKYRMHGGSTTGHMRSYDDARLLAENTLANLHLGLFHEEGHPENPGRKLTAQWAWDE